MALTREQVEHIAELAKLSLDEAEIEMFREQLSAILDHAHELAQLDIESIPPTASVLPLRSVLAADVVRDSSLDRQRFLDNAPEAEAGQVRVQSILDE
ncbi:MAG: Asp-tRNA(Asn)/Glu-tRNA(Gln) amidotransferase subunit GatC [Chloroflexi bacterium]|nr:Asp-tRNA(Asn)/Glu-tRNA(Gln) amidotransferase subunit GatC [Chloroflexota bacterium]